ncbi:hypothetical protein N7517_001869 [Penicillium concentricum]|uniref:Uncharacterized protein n=1 Tax=Penicillium concentricum TaxID=293559 RepID=A0A9W9SSM2_9EURO|nr:uncharacterized protein N7517_001869 [Penicillium concentricum]KAJ5383958.1 hypothetical protein N7517_001869 [Penicillium concentricum]
MDYSHTENTLKILCEAGVVTIIQLRTPSILTLPPLLGQQDGDASVQELALRAHPEEIIVNNIRPGVSNEMNSASTVPA